MNFKLKLQAALVLVVVLAVGGCENDPVAPHDDPPVLSAQDTANQAGMVAVAATVIGPALLNGVVNKDPAEDIFFNNEDGISGTAHLEYFLGGPNGEPSSSEAADYAHLFTDEGQPLMVELGLGGGADFSFDLEGDIDQENEAAVINGSGYFRSGPYMSHFEINDMAVDNNSEYPNAGTIVFAGLLYEIIAYCDGTFQAILAVTNGPSFSLNLDTGDVSPLSEDN